MVEFKEFGVVQDDRAEAEAEIILCGSLLHSPNETINLIRGRVSAEDFSSDLIREVYLTAAEFVNSGKMCDSTLIEATLAERTPVYDREFLGKCVGYFTTWRNAGAYADLIREYAIRRKEADIGVRLAQRDLDALGALTELQVLLSSANSSVASSIDAADSFLTYFSAVSTGEYVPFISTGYPCLDGICGGLVQSGLITLAARPGIGKTTAALNIAENVAKVGKKVLYFSLEMDHLQLWARRAAICSGLSYSAIYRGTLDEEQQGKLVNAVNEISSRNFLIYDKPCSVDDVERISRCTDGTDLIVIDHIGLLQADNSFRGSRYEIMTNISHRLKQLALSLRIPILALCQLNRSSENRESKEPSLGDLRDTGAIEEDSDAVILLFRPAQYASEELKPKPWEAQDIDFMIAKNRHGFTGKTTLRFWGINSRILEK